MLSYYTFFAALLSLLVANTRVVEAKLGDRLESILSQATDAVQAQHAPDDTAVDAQFELECECECTLTDGSTGVIVSNSPFFVNLCIPTDYVFIFLFVPWWLFSLLAAGLTFFITRKKRLSFVVLTAFIFIYALDIWNMSMQTLALMVIATFISIAIGLPLGVLISRYDRLRTFTLPILDTMQTMPSFVYLIPALMLFGLGKVPAVFATVTSIDGRKTETLEILKDPTEAMSDVTNLLSYSISCQRFSSSQLKPSPIQSINGKSTKAHRRHAPPGRSLRPAWRSRRAWAQPHGHHCPLRPCGGPRMPKRHGPGRAP